MQLLSWVLACAAILHITNTQSVGGTLSITLTNSIVQSQSDYIFNVVFVYNDPFVIGTFFEITFPSEYVSSPTVSYLCDITTWPFAVSTTPTCQITNRVLTLNGAFPQQYIITQDTVFEFVVHGVTNPQFAGQTSSFIGRAAGPDLSTITTINSQMVIIVTGSLAVQLVSSPAIVSTSADLTVLVNTSHPLPANSILRFYSAANTWDRANSVNPEPIFRSSPSCNHLNNTPSNLYCTTATLINQRIITVYNVNILGSSASVGPVSFSFLISSIQTPPSTEPQGAFTVTVMDSSSRPIDSSQNNKLGGLSPKQIMSPGVVLDNYVAGELSNMSISLSISSFIETSDTLSIQIPNCISLSSLSYVQVGSTQIASFSINSNIISFTGIQIVNPIPITVWLSEIRNPEYVVDVSSLGSTFNIWTSRNMYKIDSAPNPFTYVTLPGWIQCSNLNAGSFQAGVLTSYTFTLQFQHNISKDSQLQIAFASSYFSISVNNSLSCSTTLSTSCSITILSANLLRFSNLIQASNANKYGQISLTITGVRNPTIVGQFSGLQASTYTQSGYLVDKIDNITGFSVIGRQLESSRVRISSTSTTVYSITDVTLSISTNNPLTPSCSLNLLIPDLFDTTSLLCTPYCNIVLTSLGYVLLNIDISSFYNYSSPATIVIILSSLRNPKSTRPTPSFQLHILDGNNQQLEYVTSGLQYRLCTTPAVLSVTLNRNSTINSDQYVNYQFKIGLSFTITSAVAVRLQIPNSLTCTSCISSSSNSAAAYYTYLTVTSSLTPIILTAFMQSTVSISVTNHYSLEPINIMVSVTTADLAYIISIGTVTVTNTLSNTITLAYSFTPSSQQILSSTTTLSLSNITVIYGGFTYANIILGSEFDATWAYLSSGSNYYNLTVISSTLLSITKTTASSALLAENMAIANISTPAFTPSTSIVIQTFTSSGYKADRSVTSIIWQTSCNLPCKSCLSTVDNCQSCYSNPLLVQSRILHFSNGSSSTCLASCPDTFYLQSSSSSCQPCSSSCYTCTNDPQLCTACPVLLPYLLTFAINGTTTSSCNRICPSGYYASNSTSPSRCLACSTDRHCLSCSDYFSCSGCQPTYYLYLQNCLVSCPNFTTVGNQYTWTCDTCPNNCSTCARDTSSNSSFVVKCLTCNQGFLLDRNRCYTSCISYGLVPDIVTGQCTGCHVSCLTCAQTATNCITCNTSSTSSYFLLNRCLSQCPNGYYPSSSLFLCLPCTYPCQYCNSSSVSSCLSCVTGFSLFGSVCQGVCPSGYFQNASSCIRCPSQCLSCTSATICGACAANYSLFAGQCLPVCSNGYVQVNRVCIQCSTNCKTCSLVNYCTTCMPSLYLHQGQCVNPCPSQYYALISSLSQATCSQCPYQCSQCTSPIFCLSCTSGYQLVTTNSSYVSCNSVCSTGYVPINAICQPCITGCLGCTYTQSNCSACAINYYIYANTALSTTLCYSACPVYLFVYAAAYKCIDTCSSTMYANITYSTINTSLIIHKQCIECPILCVSCTSQSSCLQCIGGSSILNGTCYTTCPVSAPYSVNNVCVSCNIDQCYQCAANICVQCNSNYLLILTANNNLCISGCSSNMIYNVTARDCIYINNNTNNSNSGNGTTTNNTASNTTINYIPLPYALIGIVAVVVVFVLKMAIHVQVFSNLFGIFFMLLQLATITTTVTIIAQFVYTYNSASSSSYSSSSSSRLLTSVIAQSQSVSIGSILASSISYKIMLVLCAVIAILLLINIVVFIIYCCIIRTPIYRYRVVSILSLVLGCKLIGGLLTAGYYGINMKALKKIRNYQINQPISGDNNQIDKQQQQSIQLDADKNRGRSRYARTATKNFSNANSDATFLQQLINRKNKDDSRSINQSKINKKNSKGVASIKQSKNSMYSQKKSSKVSNKQKDKQFVKSVHMVIEDNHLNNDRGNQIRASQNSQKRFLDDQQVQQQLSINNSQRQKQQLKQIPTKTKKQIIGSNAGKASQSINSSSYKPSQLHSLPNKLSKRSSFSINKPGNISRKLSVYDDSNSKIEQQQSKQQLNINNNNNVVQINNNIASYQLQQAIQQYARFWYIYDRIILLHIITDITLIACGIILCFNSTYWQYQFYGGIQLILFGILDIVCTALWRLWTHDTPNKQQQEDITSKYTVNQFVQQYSQMSKQKLYPQHNDDQILTHNSKQDKQHVEIEWKQDNVQQQYTELGKKETKTQIDVEPSKQIGHINDNGNKADDMSRVYQSEFARPIDVIRLKNQQIEQALNRGVYRQNKRVLAQQQLREDEQSKLDNAQKFNRVSNQQSDDHIAEVYMQKQQKSNGTLKSKKQNQNKQSAKDNDNEDQKQINEIIFENNDEESLDTQGDQQIVENNLKHSQERKRKGSLGSQKQKNDSKLVDPIPAVHQKVDTHAKPRQSPQKKQTIQIEDMEDIQLRKQPTKDKVAQLAQQQSREYTNIFEGELQQEDMSEDFINSKNNNKKQEQQMEIVNLNNVYKNRKQVKTVMNNYEMAVQDQLKVVPSSKKPVGQVIYADLDSVGTVSEFDAINQDMPSLNEDRFQRTGTIDNRFKSLDYKDEHELYNDLDRPSNFINTNFRYHNKNDRNQGALPHTLTISRPKKSSKKSTTSKIIK